MIRTLLIPKKSKNNIFCNILSENLKKEGIILPDIDHFSYRWVLKNNIDIVHFQWWEFNSIFSSCIFFRQLIWLKKKGIKICWTIHDIQPHENKRPVFNFINYFLMTKLADSIIVLSSWEKRKVKKLFLTNEKKIFIAPHGSYIGYYKNNHSKKKARKFLKIRNEKFVYLFLGAIRKYKGIVDLIKAFKKIKRQNDLLLIAGKIWDRRLAKEIIRLKDDSIILDLNFIEDDKIQYFYNASDACVFPFKKITNSASILLAMSFGKPVICPNKGSPSEIIKPDFGILYKKGELAKAMTKIKKKNLDRMDKNAYEEAKKYDWNSIIKEYIKVYRYLLG